MISASHRQVTIRTMTQVSIEQLTVIAKEKVPMVGQLGLIVESAGGGSAEVSCPYHHDFLRPGGTISGPVLMATADFAMYAAVLGEIGLVELAVTTNLNINFLRRPQPGDVVGKAKILKLGRRLAVGEVALYIDGDDEMVAHVTCTYSIPPGRQNG